MLNNNYKPSIGEHKILIKPGIWHSTRIVYSIYSILKPLYTVYTLYNIYPFNIFGNMSDLSPRLLMSFSCIVCVGSGVRGRGENFVCCHGVCGQWGRRQGITFCLLPWLQPHVDQTFKFYLHVQFVL